MYIHVNCIGALHKLLSALLFQSCLSPFKVLYLSYHHLHPFTPHQFTILINYHFIANYCNPVAIKWLQ
jgi:hypothetical protein